jgi:hypothetical protein
MKYLKYRLYFFCPSKEAAMVIIPYTSVGMSLTSSTYQFSSFIMQ